MLLVCGLMQISTEEIREMEKEEAWQPTKGVPVLDEDIIEVQPLVTSPVLHD